MSAPRIDAGAFRGFERDAHSRIAESYTDRFTARAQGEDMQRRIHAAVTGTAQQHVRGDGLYVPVAFLVVSGVKR